MAKKNMKKLAKKTEESSGEESLQSEESAPPAPEPKKKEGKSAKEKQKQAAQSKDENGGKEKKKPETPAKTFTDAEKAELSKTAVKEILVGLAGNDTGRNYVPEGWASRFKEALGPYKKFLASQNDTFTVSTEADGNFTIRKAGEVPVEEPESKPWVKHLMKAWMCYCQGVKREDRMFSTFLASLPKTAKSMPHASQYIGVVSSPKLAAAGSPAPKAADAAEQPGKKRKSKHGKDEKKDKKAQKAAAPESDDDDEDEDGADSSEAPPPKKKKGKA